MKKFKTLLATVALALPMAVTPLAPAATLLANAATTKAAKSTTENLLKAPTIKKVAYHATKAGVPIYKITFAADKSVATLTPTTKAVATKTTYTTTKTVEVTTGKKGTKPTTYLLLKTSKGSVVGWVKATSLTKGAYKVPAKKTELKKTSTKKTPKRATTKKAVKKSTKKATTKKVTKKATPKKTAKSTVKKMPKKAVAAKTTWLELTKRATLTKKAYTSAKVTPYYRAAFAADRPTVSLTKAGTLKAGKTYHATKAFYAKTSAKASTHEYVLLTGAGWTPATALKTAK